MSLRKLTRDQHVYLLHSSAETLDEPAATAVDAMRQIVMMHTECDAARARALVGLLGQLRVSQIVNPQKTVRLEMPLA